MTRRTGFVALIGAPNAGKSTLVNRLVGTKVSIVTHKVQTTRFRIRGIAIEGTTQIVVVDTPGLFRPRRRLDRAMTAAAWGGVAGADIVVLLVDARRGISENVERILGGLADIQPDCRVILAINKIDTVEAPVLPPLSQDLNGRFPFAGSFMISARKGYGVKDLRRWLARKLPEGEWLYPEDQVADLPLRLLAAETTREKLILRLHQELPYLLTVETEEWEERKDGSVRIGQLIYVARDGHKGILLGQGGGTIKEIGRAARTELESVLNRRVHLFLQVKVRPDWLDDAERFAGMGLDYRDGDQ